MGQPVCADRPAGRFIAAGVAQSVERAVELREILNGFRFRHTMDELRPSHGQRMAASMCPSRRLRQ